MGKAPVKDPSHVQQLNINLNSSTVAKADMSIRPRCRYFYGISGHTVHNIIRGDVDRLESNNAVLRLSPWNYHISRQLKSYYNPVSSRRVIK